MSPPRILIVEDEAFVRTLIIDTLTDAGFDVDHALNADAALRMIEEVGYSIMVTEINLCSGVNGVELAQRADASNAGLPVIFVAERSGAAAGLRRIRIKAEGYPSLSPWMN